MSHGLAAVTQAALSQMNRMLPGSSGWTEGIPLWPRSILNASLWGSWWTDAGFGESPCYVIMLAECEVPCGPGGTDHLILPLCIWMCDGERHRGEEEEKERQQRAVTFEPLRILKLTTKIWSCYSRVRAISKLIICRNYIIICTNSVQLATATIYHHYFKVTLHPKSF